MRNSIFILLSAFTFFTSSCSKEDYSTEKSSLEEKNLTDDLNSFMVGEWTNYSIIYYNCDIEDPIKEVPTVCWAKWWATFQEDGKYSESSYVNEIVNYSEGNRDELQCNDKGTSVGTWSVSDEGIVEVTRSSIHNSGAFGPKRYVNMEIIDEATIHINNDCRNQQQSVYVFKRVK